MQCMKASSSDLLYYKKIVRCRIDADAELEPTLLLSSQQIFGSEQSCALLYSSTPTFLLISYIVLMTYMVILMTLFSQRERGTIS